MRLINRRIVLYHTCTTNCTTEKKANVLVFHKRGTIARLERINQGNSLKICFPENYFIRKLPKNIDSGIIQNINILKITPFVESLL